MVPPEWNIAEYLPHMVNTTTEEGIDRNGGNDADLYEVAYRQAEEEFQKASRQVAALEEETVKALTRESQLDLGVVNGMP